MLNDFEENMNNDFDLSDSDLDKILAELTDRSRKTAVSRRFINDVCSAETDEELSYIFSKNHSNFITMMDGKPENKRKFRSFLDSSGQIFKNLFVHRGRLVRAALALVFIFAAVLLPFSSSVTDSMSAASTQYEIDTVVRYRNGMRFYDLRVDAPVIDNYDNFVTCSLSFRPKGLEQFYKGYYSFNGFERYSEPFYIRHTRYYLEYLQDYAYKLSECSLYAGKDHEIRTIEVDGYDILYSSYSSLSGNYYTAVWTCGEYGFIIHGYLYWSEDEFIDLLSDVISDVEKTLESTK